MFKKNGLLKSPDSKPKEKYLLLFAVAFIGMMISFIPSMIVNKGIFLYYGDFNSQQMMFYQHCHDAVRSGNMGWDWGTDLGSSFIGSYAFLSRTANKLHLDTPWTIPVIYLGFGAGLAVFMFSGFVKSIPLEIEEAAVIDGCGPLRTFFLVVLPMMKPTFISVGVLEIMWVWNDFLLPYLVLDRTKYMTIPIVIQHLKGSYGQVDMGATMALILLSILPVIVFYLLCQKHIIKGVAAGAVKG